MKYFPMEMNSLGDNNEHVFCSIDYPTHCLGMMMMVMILIIINIIIIICSSIYYY